MLNAYGVEACVSVKLTPNRTDKSRSMWNRFAHWSRVSSLSAALSVEIVGSKRAWLGLPKNFLRLCRESLLCQ